MDFLLDIGLFLLGVGITLLVLWFQERSAIVYVDCYLNDDENPHTINCRVKNVGRGEAKDVYIGFNHSIPLDTVLISKPEIGSEIVEANNPPNPTLSPNASKYTKAFAIRLPRVAAKSNVEFSITTTHQDNIRASDQIQVLHYEIGLVLHEFINRIIKDNSELQSNIDLDIIQQARIKRSNLFTPGNYSYQEGSFPIHFLTEKDNQALAMLNDLTKKFKAGYVDVFKTGKEFKAPVIRIKTLESDCTYAIFPPFVKTYVEAAVRTQELVEKGTMFIYPPVPDEY